MMHRSFALPGKAVVRRLRQNIRSILSRSAVPDPLQPVGVLKVHDIYRLHNSHSPRGRSPCDRRLTDRDNMAGGFGAV